MELLVGGGQLDRTLSSPQALLDAYRTDDGLRYLDYRPIPDPSLLVPDDLAVTILINSRVGPAAFKSIQDRGHELDLAQLPSTPLEESTPQLRDLVAQTIAVVTSWPGFAASVATKVLHKKRSALIPILDNEAIFGAYMNPQWPEAKASQDSIYSFSRIREAIEWIYVDLIRFENASAWEELIAQAPERSRIEIFDMSRMNDRVPGRRVAMVYSWRLRRIRTFQESLFASTGCSHGIRKRCSGPRVRSWLRNVLRAMGMTRRMTAMPAGPTVLVEVVRSPRLTTCATRERRRCS